MNTNIDNLRIALEGALRSNASLTENLRDGAPQALAQILDKDYTIRQGLIVKKATNIEAEAGELFKIHGRHLYKNLGQGRYLAKYSDNRDKWQIEENAKEVHTFWDQYIKLRPEVLVNEEPARILGDELAKHYVVESDGEGSFQFVQLIRGVAAGDTLTPAQAFSKLLPYVDPFKTDLKKLRLAAKFKAEGQQLGGDKIEERLEREYYSIPTIKKAPRPMSLEDLKADLAKEQAHKRGFPADRSLWTAAEIRNADGYGEIEIESEKARAWERWTKYSTERDPQFYRNVRAKFSGLDYSHDHTVDFKA